MGTEISLDVGGMTVAWSKNMRGTDHGPLYQEQDRKRLTCNRIDYAYFSYEEEDPAGFEMSFSRSLRLRSPAMEESFGKQGAKLVLPTPDEMKQKIQAAVPHFAKLIKDAGITVE